MNRRTKKQIAWTIIIAAGIALFMATGCKATKTTSKQEIKAETETRAQVTTDGKATAKSETESDRESTYRVNDASDTETTSTTITYDTSKPVLPETGRPPIASEQTVKTTRVNVTDKAGTVKETSTQKTTADMKVEQKTKVDQDKAEIEKKQETRRTRQPTWVGAAAIASGIIILALIFYLRRSRIIAAIAGFFKR